MTSESRTALLQTLDAGAHPLDSLEGLLEQVTTLEPKLGYFTPPSDGGELLLVLRGAVRVIEDNVVTSARSGTLIKGAAASDCRFWACANTSLARLSPEEHLDNLPTAAKAALQDRILDLSQSEPDGDRTDGASDTEAADHRGALPDPKAKPQPSAPGNRPRRVWASLGRLPKLARRLRYERTKDTAPAIPDEGEPDADTPPQSLWLRLKRFFFASTKRYPIIRQIGPTDCGVACLAMVGAYWGGRFSPSQLRSLVQLTRTGVSLADLAEAAESLGFAARPVKVSLDRLAEHTLPAICHWEKKHYVVLYEIGVDHVIVGDPAVGQKRLTREAFEAGWIAERPDDNMPRGYALMLKPLGQLSSVLRDDFGLATLAQLLGPHRGALTQIMTASIVIQVLGLIGPLFTQLIIDRVVPDQAAVTLTAIGVGLLLMGAFRIALTSIREHLLDHLGNRLSFDFRVAFVDHLFRVPWRFFEDRYTGDVVTRVNETETLRHFLVGELPTVVLDILLVAIYATLMFWYNAKLAGIVLLSVPLLVLITIVTAPFLRTLSREELNSDLEEGKLLIDAVSGVRAIKAHAAEQPVQWRWEGAASANVRQTFKRAVFENYMSVAVDVVQTVATIALLWLGAKMVMDGSMTIGQLIAVNMLFTTVLGPFTRLSLLWSEVQEVRVVWERLREVLDVRPEADERRMFLNRRPENIRLVDVAFSYQPSMAKPTIEGMDLDIGAGEKVAIVGHSGSGKSTLTSLLMGLIAPTSGRVLVNGQDLAQLEPRHYRAHVGYVEQDCYLLGETVSDAISLGRAGLERADVERVCRAIGATSFIEQLAYGWDTPIGEGGCTLSGGQRQRLALARALIGQPGLLILDEPTANLDASSAQHVMDLVLGKEACQTVIVVTHQLELITEVDRIIVMGDGMVLESGCHDALLARQGAYCELYRTLRKEN